MLARLKVSSLTRKLRLLSNTRRWEVAMSCPLLEDLRGSNVNLLDVELVDISIPLLKKLVWNVPIGGG